MGLYNFRERFAAGIESGEITHTIRGPRNYGRQRDAGRQDRPGDVMHLYTGMRTKACRLLGRFPCAAVEEIQIANVRPGSPAIWINGELLSMDESDNFARRDGFKSFAVFLRYWRSSGKLPFEGFIFHWDFSRPVKIVKPRAVSAPKRKRSSARQGLRSVAGARLRKASGRKRSNQAANIGVQ